MLEQGGFRADIAASAEVAKRLLAQHTYSAMTLDLILPGQNGVSLIRELRSEARARDLPIVVVSAKANEGREELNGSSRPLPAHAATNKNRGYFTSKTTLISFKSSPQCCRASPS